MKFDIMSFFGDYAAHIVSPIALTDKMPLPRRIKALEAAGYRHITDDTVFTTEVTQFWTHHAQYGHVVPGRINLFLAPVVARKRNNKKITTTLRSTFDCPKIDSLDGKGEFFLFLKKEKEVTCRCVFMPYSPTFLSGTAEGEILASEDGVDVAAVMEVVQVEGEAIIVSRHSDHIFAAIGKLEDYANGHGHRYDKDSPPMEEDIDGIEAIRIADVTFMEDMKRYHDAKLPRRDNEKDYKVLSARRRSRTAYLEAIRKHYGDHAFDLLK